jgi:hypothetical protein
LSSKSTDQQEYRAARALGSKSIQQQEYPAARVSSSKSIQQQEYPAARASSSMSNEQSPGKSVLPACINYERSYKVYDYSMMLTQLLPEYSVTLVPRRFFKELSINPF